MTSVDGLHSKQVFNFPHFADDSVTVTIWRDDAAMRAFAYRAGDHKVQLDRQKSSAIADRTSFTGFRVLEFYGSEGARVRREWVVPTGTMGTPFAGGVMDQNGPVLEPPELERFIKDGYLIVRSALPTELVEECRVSAAQQLGIDLASPNTWRRPVVRGVPTGDCFSQAADAPRLIDAIGQLVNPDAWQPRPNLGAFVVRFPSDEDPGDAGWHIDSSFQPPGDSRWFVNYRSKERALLLLCLVSDVGDGRRAEPSACGFSSRDGQAACSSR